MLKQGLRGTGAWALQGKGQGVKGLGHRHVPGLGGVKEFPGPPIYSLVKDSRHITRDLRGPTPGMPLNSLSGRSCWPPSGTFFTYSRPRRIHLLPPHWIRTVPGMQEALNHCPQINTWTPSGSGLPGPPSGRSHRFRCTSRARAPRRSSGLVLLPDPPAWAVSEASGYECTGLRYVASSPPWDSRNAGHARALLNWAVRRSIL
ncbi:hypothetical protein VULLAG_LOCUS21815 [Vulpes lagopus]